MLTENNLLVRVAEQFLEQVFQELAVEERIEVRYRLSGEGNPMQRAFFATTKEAAGRSVQLGKSRDVYVGVAPRLGENGTKAGVALLWALWADLDLKHGHTRESRIKQLHKLPCRPSMLVWSGGGWHPYWLLTKPAEGPEELKRAELVMQRLAEGLTAILSTTAPRDTKKSAEVPS